MSAFKSYVVLHQNATVAVTTSEEAMEAVARLHQKIAIWSGPGEVWVLVDAKPVFDRTKYGWPLAEEDPK